MLNRPHSAKLLKSLSPQAKIINISNSNSGNANNFTSSNKIK